jgi:hypothetical protein
MRLEYQQPANFCHEGLTEALQADGIAGLTGVSTYSGTVAIEMPGRDVPLSAQEQATIQALVASHPASWQRVRSEREPLLRETDWRIQRAEDEGGDSSALRRYRQALRDVTEEPDAREVVWPARPW